MNTYRTGAKLIQKGLVSVMMPAYNAEQFIGEAIESVQAQSYPYWELIVVNDGSKDHTNDVVSKYHDPRIKLIHQENRGEAAARNTALDYVQGEFLSFLDADDLYMPHHLEETAGYLSTHSGLDGVYTDGYYVDAHGKRLKALSSRRRGPFEGQIFEEVVYGSDVFGPPVCVMLRSYLISENHLRFDENIVIGPDWDFFIKYAEKGWFGYLDKITCLYRVHATNISLRTSMERRTLELAKCRINAIKLNGFNSCSERTRYNVFYDVLINTLIYKVECQSDLIEWPEFRKLRRSVQARLLRLMASKLLLSEGENKYIKIWLNKARQINPLDWRGTLLWFLYILNPRFLKMLLGLRRGRQPDSLSISPFADLHIENNH
jgi:glycosyltransferase involved in cell wall biosynthesis